MYIAYILMFRISRYTDVAVSKYAKFSLIEEASCTKPIKNKEFFTRIAESIYTFYIFSFQLMFNLCKLCINK